MNSFCCWWPQKGHCHIFVSYNDETVCLSFSAHLPGQSQECQSFNFFLSLSRFTTACCLTGTFGIWISLNNSDFFLSLSPHPHMKEFRYLHFYAWVYFSSGNRNSVSGVESQCCCVLECLSLPFHLHPNLTALCFSVAVPSAPPSLYLSPFLVTYTVTETDFLSVVLNICFRHWILCLFPLHPIFGNFSIWARFTVAGDKLL